MQFGAMTTLIYFWVFPNRENSLMFRAVPAAETRYHRQWGQGGYQTQAARFAARGS